MADTLESLEIEVRHSATGAADAITNVTNAIRSMSRAIKTALPRLMALNEALGGEALVFNNIDAQVTATVSNVTNVSRSAGRATNDISRGIRSMSNAARRANKPLGNFVSSLKRIAFYRFIRSIIKAITQAFSEGLQWAYQFSAGIQSEGHRFAAALDSMKSASTQMKAQLGSAFISLLALIEPILERIIAVITRVADAMAQFFAVFTGGTYLKATETSQKFADTMKTGGKAAKEWKNQLLGFDEINRLDAPSDGGGGGGSAAIDPSSLFEETEIDGFFKRLKDKLEEFKNSFDFTKAIESWKKLKEQVKEFANLVGNALLWVWDNVLVPLAHWTIETAAPVVLDLLTRAFEFFRTALEKLQPVFQWAWENIFMPLAEWTGEVILKALESLTSLFEKLTNLLNGNTTFKEFLNDLTPLEEILLAVGVAIGVVTAAVLYYNTVAAIAALVTGALNLSMILIVAAIALVAVAIIELIKHWDELTAIMEDFATRVRRSLANAWNAICEDVKMAVNIIAQAFVLLWEGIVYTARSMLNGLIWLVEGVLNFIISGINAVVKLLAQVANMFSSMFGLGGKFDFTIGKVSLPRFAEGGFPEDGLFFANHNELLGKFMNGKTAVANNEQIIAGIEEGVFRAVTAAIAGREGNNDGGMKSVELDIDGRTFFRAIWDDYKAVLRERGVSLVTG